MVLIRIDENLGEKVVGKLPPVFSMASYVSANGELDQGEKRRRSGREEGEMRESPLVVKRADRNLDTFVGLARTYARLDKQDRYDRYSPVRREEIHADRSRIDGSPRVVFVVEPS